MPMTETEPSVTESLMWGLQEALPARYAGAWGARAPVMPDGSVAFIPDQQDVIGDPKILEILVEVTPLNSILHTVDDLLRSRIMHLDRDETFVLAQEDGYAVLASSEASGEYVSMVAWYRDLPTPPSPRGS